MRFLDKLISFIFSVVVIVLAVIVCMISVNVLQYGVIDGLLREYVFINDSQMNLYLTLSSILVILAGLKVTVFSSSLSPNTKKSIMVDTANGKIQIAQDTIENIATSVIKDYDQIKNVQARMAKARKGINMYMMLMVYEGTNIKEIVTKIQDEVKRQIESTTSVRVCNVDIKIKNVVNPATRKETKKVVAETKTKTVESVPTEKAQIVESHNEPLVSKPASEEYLKDENDVLYRVEANPNAPENDASDGEDNNKE